MFKLIKKIAWHDKTYEFELGSHKNIVEMRTLKQLNILNNYYYDHNNVCKEVSYTILNTNCKLYYLEMAYFYAHMLLVDMHLQACEYDDLETIPNTRWYNGMLFNAYMSQM